MTAKLTDDLRQAIEEHGDTPLFVVDEATKQEYVIMRAKVFEKLRPLLEDEHCDPRELYPLVEACFGKAGWDDPAMDVYNDYEANRPKP